jgi:hypothetical protein
MATRTSTGVGGDWSAAGTWDTGVPLDGDTVIVAEGTTVDFDVDQSAFVTGIIMRIDGILTVKAGADRYMKLGGNVTFGSSGTREWRIGSAETPFPVTNKFTLDLNGAKEVTLTNGKCLWYCAEPVTRSIRLSGAEAAGQTELSVDTDVSGESDHWYAGAEVRIDNVNKANDSELRTIAVGGVAAGVITITAGLTASKVAGSYVHLLTRNIRVIGHAGSGRCFYGGSGSILGADIRPSATGSGITSSYGCTVSTISGCDNGINRGSGNTVSTISGCDCGIYYGSGCTVSTISGCTYGIYYGYGNTVSTISGCDDGINGGYGNTVSTISGCDNGIIGGSGNTVSTISGCDCGIYRGSGNTVSTISGCTYGIYYGSGNTVSTISGCDNGINRSGARLVGCGFSGNIADIATDVYAMADALTTRSYQHNGVAGDNRVWCGAGSGATDATVAAPGFADSFKLTMTNASFWTRMDDEITVYEGRPIVIVGQIKNGTTGLTGRARLELFEELAEDPLPFGGTPIEQDIAPDDTDWHEVRWLYTPAKTTTLTIRFSAKHGSNNAWGAWRVENQRTPRLPWPSLVS